ncbi:tyrosine/tryptophan transporter protein [Chloropicon primus]|uniref:Tyrosine/tryptophan transporter protein n=1 Tax=Chloropicon primus TaxID=1764295 RepID=A0A5B8MTQ3_9CHLO|nr:tyrosine/tryptophan transporter protein [Chloropicon primus]|eukprot:QDZ22820.1 tyrosine/tryptophan transporter protein [Chloropicon primus]
MMEKQVVLEGRGGRPRGGALGQWRNNTMNMNNISNVSNTFTRKRAPGGLSLRRRTRTRTRTHLNLNHTLTVNAHHHKFGSSHTRTTRLQAKVGVHAKVRPWDVGEEEDGIGRRKQGVVRASAGDDGEGAPDLGQDEDKQSQTNQTNQTNTNTITNGNASSEMIEATTLARVLPEIYGKEDGEEEDGEVRGKQGCPLLPRPLFMLEIKALDAMKQKDMERVVDQSVSKGLANAVLLRDGDLSSAMMTEIASSLYPLCSALGVKFLVEDRIDIVAASLADGILFNGVDSQMARIMIKSIEEQKKAEYELEMKQRGEMTKEERIAYDYDVLSSHEDEDYVEEAEEMEMEGDNHGVPEGDGEEPRSVLTGRFVRSLEEAKKATKQEHDFVLIEGDTSEVEVNDNGNGNGNASSKSRKSPVLALQDIRKGLSSHMVLTSNFCRAVGGPKASFNVGADGIQIPLREARRLLDCIVGIEQKNLPKSGRLLGAILLIAGSTVGAGIIAMPVKTAQAGFLPTIFTLSGAWLFMVLTAMLLVEASLWYGPEVNLLSMAQNTLGITGRTVCMCLYLFIYAATLTAYLSEGAAMCMPLVSRIFFKGASIPSWLGITGFTAVSGVALYSGPKKIDLLNRVCVMAALYSFVQLIVRCSGSLQPTLLARANWEVANKCLPIMVVAFTFHNIIPSLVGYLGSPRTVVKAIFLGSFIPFALYIIWQAIILGTLPEALVGSLKSGTDVVRAVGGVASSKVSMHVTIFSFFAIVTSLLGIGMGCVDFVKDALPDSISSKKRVGGLVALVLTILPPLGISILAPGAFYAALEFSGTFRLILFGIIPVLMVYKGRKSGELPWLPGGVVPLLFVMAIASSVIGMELWTKIDVKQLASKFAVLLAMK